MSYLEKIRGVHNNYSRIGDQETIDLLRGKLEEAEAINEALIDMKDRVDAVGVIEADNIVEEAEGATKRLKELYKEASALVLGPGGLNC